jgi:hypothetical protein
MQPLVANMAGAIAKQKPLLFSISSGLVTALQN